MAAPDSGVRCGAGGNTPTCSWGNPCAGGCGCVCGAGVREGNGGGSGTFGASLLRFEEGSMVRDDGGKRTARKATRVRSGLDKGETERVEGGRDLGRLQVPRTSLRKGEKNPRNIKPGK